MNHPFIDGNKRTGILAMISLLLEYKIKLTADKDELYKFTISNSTDEIHFDKIVNWLVVNTASL